MTGEDAVPAGSDFLEAGRKLFAGPCDFIWGAAKIDALPPIEGVEFAFAGRSNVGKSSLINALTQRKTLARVSHTPGRTQELNFFQLGANARLVDMPGYGYAAVSKEKIAAFSRLMRDFLRGRANLARTYVLVDSRHGLKIVDNEMFDLLDQAAVSYAVVLTKIDEIKPGAKNKILEAVLTALRKRPAAYPEIYATSSRTGEGAPELRAAIAKLIAERGTMR